MHSEVFLKFIFQSLRAFFCDRKGDSLYGLRGQMKFRLDDGLDNMVSVMCTRQ